MGLRYVVEESVRLPQLHSICVPEGVEGQFVMIGAG